MGEIGNFFSDVQGGLRKLFTTLEDLDRNTSASVTGYINKVSVNGTVYMEQNIVEDDISIPLMGCLNQMYVSWILCALGLDARCADGRTVNERMRLVHGLQMLESDLLDKIKSGFGMGSETKLITASSEASNNPLADTESSVTRLATGRLVEFDFNTGASMVTEMRSTDPDIHTTKTTTPSGVTQDEKTSKGGGYTQKVGPAGSCKAYFYVMLHPFMINHDVYKNFMQLNFIPKTSERWRAVRAKEISFWKDFIFARDIVEREIKTLKNDKSGLVTELMSRQKSGVWRWIGGMLGIIPESHNLANAILVFDKQSFDASCREARIDFSNASQRTLFFRKTFTMMVVVVDTMYGRVDMYYAGVPSVGNYTFNTINKIGSGKNDNFDLKSIITAFASGASPRF